MHCNAILLTFSSAMVDDVDFVDAEYQAAAFLRQAHPRPVDVVGAVPKRLHLTTHQTCGREEIPSLFCGRYDK